MMEVKDRRFENGDWPIKFEVPVEQEQADRWPRYLRAACHRRSWASSGLGQLERVENSGTITVTANGKPQLEIVWERKRDRPMKVRARLASSSDLSSSEAEQFFNEVNNSCGSAVTEPIYVRGTLQYDGLAWRGELWLDDKMRFGPPNICKTKPRSLVRGCSRGCHFGVHRRTRCRLCASTNAFGGFRVPEHRYEKGGSVAGSWKSLDVDGRHEGL